MARFTAHAIAVCILALSSVIRSVRAQAVAAATTSADTVVLSIRLPAAYDDSPASLSLLSRLSAVIPESEYVLSRPIDIGDFIQQHFNVAAGPKARAQGVALPETYKLLATKIRSLNGMDSNEFMLAPGSVLAPSLPRKALTEWNASLGRNFVPQRLSAKLEPLGGPKPDSAQTIDNFVIAGGLELATGSSRPASRSRIVRLALPAKAASEFLAQASDLVQSGEVSVRSAPMNVTFDEPYPVPQEARSQNVNAIATRLSEWLRTHAAQRRHVPLLILDSGWPDETTYVSSRRRLRALIDTVRVHWGIGNLLDQPANEPAFVEANYPHSTHIVDALRPFVNAVDTGLVDVIYIPLSQEQHASDVLIPLFQLEELLELKTQHILTSNFVAPQFRPCRFAVASPDSTPACARLFPLDETDYGTATKDATALLSRMPSAFPRWSDPDDRQLRASSAILMAVWSLLDAATVDRDRIAFINTSWTVSQFFGRLPYDDANSTVFVVSAVGNVAGRVINDDNSTTDFARRGKNPSHFLAVINMDDTGSPTCQSSEVDASAQLLPATNAVGFNGQLEGECGSSYAAPRVAWLLALDEVLRRSRVSMNNWTTTLGNRLQATRHGSGLPGLLFDPFALYSAR